MLEESGYMRGGILLDALVTMPDISTLSSSWCLILLLELLWGICECLFYWLL